MDFIESSGEKMSSYPGKFDVYRGKSTRIRLINQILADSGGRIKYDVLKKQLKAQGYLHLIEKLEAMDFTVDDEGYVQRGPPLGEEWNSLQR